MAKVLVTESYLSAIASAIRSKTGTQQTFTPAQMAGAINAIPTGGGGGGGDTTMEDGLVTRTVSTYSNSRVTTVGQYAFAGFTSLLSVSLPNVTTIQSYAFQSAAIRSVSLPNVTTIEQYAFRSCGISDITLPSIQHLSHLGVFQSCSSLVSVNLPALIGIASRSNIPTALNTFAGCTALTDVSVPNLQYGANQAFSGCTALVSISLPQAIKIHGYMFTGCFSLSNVFMPNVTYLAAYAFQSCNSLLSIDLPKLTSISNYVLASAGTQYFRAVKLPYITSYALRAATKLKTVILQSASYISGSAFAYCYNLISLYLLSTSVVRRNTAGCFVSTPLSNYSTSAGRWGSVFVPASLYSAYLTANYWSLISDRFVSLTDAEIAALLA